MIEHRRAAQEPLHVVGLVGQRLAVQIVGHVAVVTGHRQRRRAALGRELCRQVQARRPTFGSRRHLGGRLGSQTDLRLGEDLLRPRSVQRQIPGVQRQRITRHPQPGQVGLLPTTGGNEL